MKVWTRFRISEDKLYPSHLHSLLKTGVPKIVHLWTMNWGSNPLPCTFINGYKNESGLRSGLRFWMVRSTHIDTVCTAAVPLQPWFSFADFSLRTHLQMRIWSGNACLASKFISQWVDWWGQQQLMPFSYLSSLSQKILPWREEFSAILGLKILHFSAVHSRQNSLSTHCFPLGITLSNKSPFR